MDIHDQQHRFLANLGSFLLKAEAVCRKYDLAMAAGETWRSPEEARRLAALGRGITTSLHIDRLAFDLVLKAKDRGGQWRILHGEHEAWRELGIFWKSLDDDAHRWGGSQRVFPEGDFDRLNDAGHFSSTRGGVM